MRRRKRGGGGGLGDTRASFPEVPGPDPEKSPGSLWVSPGCFRSQLRLQTGSVEVKRGRRISEEPRRTRTTSRDSESLTPGERSGESRDQREASSRRLWRNEKWDKKQANASKRSKMK